MSYQSLGARLWRAVSLWQGGHLRDVAVPQGAYNSLEGTFGLPDPDDEHFVAAAVIAQAGVIVTENLKDFPDRCLPYGLTVTHPNEFLYDSVQINEIAAEARPNNVPALASLAPQV